MKNLTFTLGRLAVVLTGALALNSCNRAEYATLPRSASYLGSTTVASTPRSATAAPATVAPTPAPAAEAPAATVATAPVVAAPAPAAVAAAPVAAPKAEAPAVVVPRAEAPAATAAAPKLNLVQRLALAKVTKKLNKLAAATPQLKQKDATANTARISGNLRTGIVLLLVGLIVGIFSNLLGTIIALIGLVFIVLWLLDEL